MSEVANEKIDKTDKPSSSWAAHPGKYESRTRASFGKCFLLSFNLKDNWKKDPSSYKTVLMGIKFKL